MSPPDCQPFPPRCAVRRLNVLFMCLSFAGVALPCAVCILAELRNMRDSGSSLSGRVLTAIPSRHDFRSLLTHTRGESFHGNA